MTNQQFQWNHLIEPTKCFKRLRITPTDDIMCSTERQQNCVLWIQISHPFPSPKVLGLHRHNLDARGRNLKPGQGQHVFDSAAFCRASRHCFSMFFGCPYCRLLWTSTPMGTDRDVHRSFHWSKTYVFIWNLMGFSMDFNGILMG